MNKFFINEVFNGELHLTPKNKYKFTDEKNIIYYLPFIALMWGLMNAQFSLDGEILEPRPNCVMVFGGLIADDTEAGFGVSPVYDYAGYALWRPYIPFYVSLRIVKNGLGRKPDKLATR